MQSESDKRNDRVFKWLQVVACFAVVLLSGCRNPATINVGPFPITASIETWTRIAIVIAILLFLLVCLILFLVLRWVIRMWQTRRRPGILEDKL